MAEKRKRSAPDNSVENHQYDQNQKNLVSESIEEFFDAEKYCDIKLVAGQDEQQ